MKHLIWIREIRATKKQGFNIIQHHHKAKYLNWKPYFPILNTQYSLHWNHLKILLIFCHCGMWRYNLIWINRLHSSLTLHPKYLNLAYGTLSLLKVKHHLKEYASGYLIKMRHSPWGILPLEPKYLELKCLEPEAKGIWALGIWLL